MGICKQSDIVSEYIGSAQKECREVFKKRITAQSLQTDNGQVEEV